MRKENQFLQWLLGENVAFPFLQDLPEVPMPEMKAYQEKEMAERDEWLNEMEADAIDQHDCHASEEDGCNACPVRI